MTRKVGAQTVDNMIRSWRRARLAAGEHVMGFPKTNILHPTHGIGTSRRGEEFGPTDAELVQSIVVKMHDGMKSVFEAYHLGIIRGENARNLPHKARALTLGMDKSTYFRRLQKGWDYVQQELTTATI